MASLMAGLSALLFPFAQSEPPYECIVDYASHVLPIISVLDRHEREDPVRLVNVAGLLLCLEALEILKAREQTVVPGGAGGLPRDR